MVVNGEGRSWLSTGEGRGWLSFGADKGWLSAEGGRLLSLITRRRQRKAVTKRMQGRQAVIFQRLEGGFYNIRGDFSSRWRASDGRCTDKKRTQNFPNIEGNSDGIGCKVIYEEGLPNI